MLELKNKLKQIENDNKLKIPNLISGKTISSASVLIGLQYDNVKKIWNILLTKRSMMLNSFPGQIAFPGGNIEPSDINEEAAAIRETKEEIGCNDLQVEVVIKLPPQIIRQKIVHSIVGFLGDNFHLQTATNLIGSTEVDAVFYVPLTEFLSEKYYSYESVEFKYQDSTVSMNLPLFNIPVDAVVLENEQQHYQKNFHARIYGFTAIMCIYTAMLVYDKCPDFHAPDVQIMATCANDVYQDMIGRLKYMLKYFSSDYVKVENANARL